MLSHRRDEEPARRATPLRRLGFTETRMHLMQTLLHGTTQGAAVVRVHGCLTPDTLRAALAKSCRRYEILGEIAIERREGELWFCRRPEPLPVPIRIEVRETDAQWVRVLEQENSTPLDLGEGLWRVIALLGSAGVETDHELIVLWHHALMDGAAFTPFVAHLLGDLGGGILEDDAGSRPLAPAVEEVFPHPASFSEFEARQRAAVLALPAFERLPHVEPAPIQARVTRVIPRELAPPAVERLKGRAAASGVSLNSHLAAALASAVKQVLPERSHCLLNTAVSLRQFCDERLSEQDLGCYLATIATSHDISDPERSVAALAREHQAAVVRATLLHARQPRDFELCALERSIGALGNGATFSADFALNALRLPVQQRYGQLELRACYGAVNRALGNLAAVVQAVELMGNLFFTLNYTSPLQREPWAAALMDRFIERLETV